jgi:hypothetical protein
MIHSLGPIAALSNQEGLIVPQLFIFGIAEGYAKALEKSTFRLSIMREVVEHWAQND